jgi:hypothetical protein
MKSFIATIPCALLIAALPALAAAQTGEPAHHVRISKKAKAKPHEQKSIEEATPVDDDPNVNLTPEELDTAKKVYTGDIPCELGQTVHITPHKRAGFFIVRAGIQRFRMQPVESRTGAIRLEDPRAGAMWLQLGNKSMLMSQKMGRRLADDCKAPAQVAYGEQLLKHPLPSILDPLPKPATDGAKAEPTPAAAAPAAPPTAAAPDATASAPK